MLEDVTFGITAFERPALLQQLVASILARFPRARIMVADSGKQKPVLPAEVETLDLKFDCGLSNARNALIDRLQTRYLLLLEDDFLFTDETRIEPLVDVLESDPEVGVVAGAVRGGNGRVSAYSLDIEVFRQTMYVRESSHRVRITRRGVPYRICDLVWNFALYRREMLRDHRWDESLKVGEHAPFFHQVKLAARWRVACCPSVVLYHVPDRRNNHYLKYRQRARKIFQGYLRRYGLTRYHRILPHAFVDDRELKPPVVLMGVGHSGTSIAAKMLHAAGWQAADADRRYGESVTLRLLNRRIQQTGTMPAAEGRQLLEQLPQPWAVKDPRFVMTLHHWLPLFKTLDRPPVLVRITRDLGQVVESYRRRNVRGDVQQMVEQRQRMGQEQYDRWPWTRLSVDYERLGEAAALFDVTKLTNLASTPPQTQTVFFPAPSPLDDHDDSTRDWEPFENPRTAAKRSGDGSESETLRASGLGFADGSESETLRASGLGFADGSESETLRASGLGFADGSDSPDRWQFDAQEEDDGGGSTSGP